jgi:Fe-S-cluster-containing dehydrogenase component
MQMAMVIDLLKCTGCGACALACKSGQNTRDRAKGQTFNWADFVIETSGRFPNVKFTTRPVLCNHCSKAACVEACPVEPKAMYKTKDGLTMHNNARCIGCRACQAACPYSKEEVRDGEYSVISFNDSTLPAATPAHRNRYAHPDYEDVRRPGIVEKCTFCDHRVKRGEQPYCVAACPAGARVFGDRDNPESEVAKLLKTHTPAVLKPEAGTQPNVFYIKSYQVAGRSA